jgi:hypothetical protein
MPVCVRHCPVLLNLILGAFLMTLSTSSASAEAFLAEFSEPPAWYHSAPLWVWNDDITEQKIDHQLEMLRSQGVLQAFVHPRPGLITPYLSEEWLDLYEFAVETAKKKGMLLHIYDENSYPSGFAGGHVYHQHPEWGGKGLVLEKVEALPEELSEDILAVYLREGDGIRLLEDAPLGQAGDFLIAKRVLDQPRPWNAGGPYVDLLEPGLTEEFLRVTYEPYRERFGKEFGQTVRGAFTDEPHLVPAGRLHWTPRLPQLFSERYGYSLWEAFPSLFEDVGDFRAARFDFYQLLLDEFIERWSKPYHDYCEKNGLLFTGHYWEHEWPRCARAQDNMAMYAYHQMPAIDCLMNRYSEDPHAQFGNLRAVVELGSIANQLGRERRLCEIYGAGGWEMTFSDQKRIADWLGVLGVNFFNQHLTYMTLRGARKRDHPLSFSDHAPYWEHYHLLGKYLGRLSYALSQGEQKNRILVLEPTTSAWLLERADGPREELEAMGASFQAFITDLSLNQVEYDLGCERTLLDHGRIEGGKFVVGERAYDLVLLHHTCSNLTGKTFSLLKDFRDEGGSLLLAGGAPKFLDGRESEEMRAFFHEEIETPQDSLLVEGKDTSKALIAQDELIGFLNERYAEVEFSPQPGGKLFHQYRSQDKEGVLFLCNTSPDQNASGIWEAEGRGVMGLNLETGEKETVPHEVENGRVQVKFLLPPAGSLLYLITSGETEKKEERPLEFKNLSVELTGIQRLAPNPLPIDYLDYQVGEQKGESVFFFKAQQAIYQAHGLAQNPWDRSVQFKDETLALDSSFDTSTGFQVSYPFVIEGFESAPSLSIWVEQPERYSVTLNAGAAPDSTEPTVDAAFKVLHFRQGASVGENRLQLKASPFSVHHEVEPIYVTGAFALESREKGWALVPEKELGYGSWREQGMPFYSDAVRYSYALSLSGEEEIVRVSLPNWKGVVAAVSVDGKPAGLIGWQPFERSLKVSGAGSHTLEVDVYGSLKNLYGPHHGNPDLGAAWPSGFLNAPETGPPAGESYHTLDYGLYEPPLLEELD